MPKIRVLVIDDSTVVRRLVSDALSGDPALEVVGAAANGRIALTKIAQVNPDVVTLDIEMPDMDGLAVLREIRKSHPSLPVIMFSTLTQRGAVATLDALALGATDYVTKPANVGSVTAAIQRVRDDLIPRIKMFCARKLHLPHQVSPHPAVAIDRLSPAARTRSVAVAARPAASHDVEIVCIGVSTGGPNALAEIFKQLPADLPAPIVIVQHMPPVFTAYLAQRLTSVSQLEVREAKAGEVLRPGCAWLAPGDFHLSVTRSGAQVMTSLHQSAHENSCRPAADVLFRGVAAVYGPAALAVILTGMGHDGLRGCEAIRAAAGRVLVQDEASSVVWGMAGAVVRAGLADEIVPLDQVASQVTRLVRKRSLHGPLATGSGA